MENENKKQVEIETVSVDEAPEISSDKQTEIIEQLNTKVAELNDKYLRIAAELENTRRRASLDIESVSRNRAMSVAEKILPVTPKPNERRDKMKEFQRELRQNEMDRIW